MDVPALAATIGGSVVGLAGLVANYLNSKGSRRTSVELATTQREHERQLARHEELRAAYEGAVTFLLTMSAVVERTHPFYGSLPPPPDRPSDEAVNAIFGRLSVIASDEVMEAMDDLGNDWQLFLFAAQDVDAERDGARRELDEHRKAFRDHLEAVQRLMRADVRK